jgi:hypothetical protein
VEKLKQQYAAKLTEQINSEKKESIIAATAAVVPAADVQYEGLELQPCEDTVAKLVKQMAHN